ncbi:BREX-1 system adenine-specific DNA-methyltransferase PglX [Aliarcobacter cryaerophilus]|uniref:BREX-1 system adenine-specific DNA-methyltransferase PglX n=1 Tax=Aliarcobacter cryaerophilus TaxID=28198 RepID=UPI0021B62D7F|nr:BREX-1 system adenine-specific DNA-methyltransferase PglX [Aliarcobacter cryaerophilus]MCT7519503.1 BREX-1 system adenine-specific DNA-methyltransferase PglX [Aliarcobacter cryaerophilus]
MSMFQKSIINSVKQDESKVALRWASFQKFLEKVEYIKTVKEEKYQDGFLVDIFENCLGYTLDMTNPKSFNLEREKKNETDGKKADGVIYVDDKVVGVIELKGQDTKNLDKIETQAFNYHASHSNSKYIIISNFDELRFYVDKKTAYEKFNLFTLNYEEFKKLHLLISYESIKDDIPLKLKEKSNSFEQDISKKLYKDFSNFRTALFENIVKNNLGNEALASSLLNGEALNQQTLLRLTQKLCDRIIFILFAEDRDLLRANMIKEIREEFINQKFTNYSLYDIYKFYFEAINKGNDKLQIPQYNGGLFATDLLLDSLIIDDFILDENVQILSNYDFASEISVNILGHIFEQSLTDLEELQANIDNVNFDKTKSKRKKDGVFYTPEYITRYIVENTLGKMCSEKREELLIGNGILIPSNPKKLTKQEQQTKDNLQEYKNWLLNLKILDPACGSGAFLNQALEYLIDEHKNLQNDLALMGDLFASYMVEEEILENNLYGVDINEDAVEIAKLSLWLRTAKRGRPLTKLADKIVCANSLLNMPFSENSFDVVIGNPPYFNIEKLGFKSSIAKNIQNKYQEIWQDKSDILFYFIALAIKMTKNKVGFIVSNAFMFSDKAQKLRNFILENSNISKITNFEKYMVFEDASVTTAIIELDKNKKSNKTLAYNFIEKNYSQHDVYEVLTKQNEYFEIKLKQDSVYALVDNEINSINEKIDKNYSKLNEIFKIGSGMQTAANDVFIFKNYPNNFPKEFIKKRMSGEIIGKYEIKDLKEFIIYFENVEKFKDLPTEIQNHLLENKEFLENRATVKNEGRIWWRYSRPMHKDFYHFNKIWCSYRAKENIFCFDDTKEYIGLTNTTVIFDTNEDLDLKYLLALLNSRTLNFRYKSIGKQTGSGVYEYFENGVGKLPIPKIDKVEQKPFIKLVDEILEAKQKIKDYKPLLDEAIKNNNFDREIALKKELENLENICTTNEKTIDQMVYKLYDLTPDEIKIVEGV